MLALKAAVSTSSHSVLREGEGGAQRLASSACRVYRGMSLCPSNTHCNLVDYFGIKPTIYSKQSLLN